jgi:hypothetical protein
MITRAAEALAPPIAVISPAVTLIIELLSKMPVPIVSKRGTIKIEYAKICARIMLRIFFLL